MKYKLGKKQFVKDQRDLKMSAYLDRSKLKEVPEISMPFEAYKGDWGMMMNDQLGDCVLAGAGHEHLLWNAEVGRTEFFPDENIVKAYSDITGYTPDNPDSDCGTVVRDAMKYRQKVGILDDAGNPHKIAAYVRIDAGDIEALKMAVYLFDAVGAGIALPDTAMEQMNNDEPWSVVEGANVEGGHYVPIVGYDKEYVYCITWGKIQKMTYEFYTKYNDEAWAILAPDFLNADGKSPDGFDFKTLQADLLTVKNI